VQARDSGAEPTPFGDDGPWPAAGAAVAPKLDKAWAALDDAPGCGKQKDPDEGWNEETRD